MKENTLLDKSKAFAVRIINLYKYLCKEKDEYVLSKQLLRSGTSIGANVREANVAIGKAEFIAKLNISLKEAAETQYWLELLYDTDFITKEQFDSIYNDCVELHKILTAVIKSSKK